MVSDENKNRKRTSGNIKDKERTKIKLVQAVGKVLLKKGYTGINATSIAKEAGVDKRLVWTYFGNLDNLVEEYITQRDYWKHKASNSINELLSNTQTLGKEHIIALLQNQLNDLINDPILQRIIHWEIGENKTYLRNLAEKREEIGEELFKLVEPQFEKENIDIRATIAIIIGAIYYLTLHGKINGSLFCGIDINNDEGKNRIENAISSLISLTFEKTSV